MKKIISTLLVGTILTNLTACGTILYPERKGQKAGQIDVAVGLLDGVGLFFFLIPGVIAYAVDFSNGTIYLPNGKHHSSIESKLSTNDMYPIYVGKENLSEENIKTIVYDHTGKIVNIHTPGVMVYKANQDVAKAG